MLTVVRLLLALYVVMSAVAPALGQTSVAAHGPSISAHGLSPHAAASDFVGTWELASIEEPTEAGEWVPARLPIRGEPVGILMYDDKGNMAVQITGSPRSVETPSDFPEIVHGYVAYYARYEVDTEEETVTHHRINHLNPAIGDLRVVRYYRFDGDVLTLTLAPDRELRLNWLKVQCTGTEGS